jgi:glycosyltransferase involved in cell wall biosynthesis
VPNAVLLIVGTPLFNRDWDYRDAIDRVIVRRNLGRKVLFAGQRRDIPQLLRGVDALIVNSVMEPFGMVLLEAMACALPVVSTNVGGVPEIIHDRRNGLLYENGEYGRLAEHICELANDPTLRTEIGARARETVTSRFTIDIQIPQLKSVYRRMAAPQTSLTAAAATTLKEEL